MGCWRAIRTVESATLSRLYVLFVIELTGGACGWPASRQPDRDVGRAAGRELLTEMGCAGRPVPQLIRDRDAKFTAAFDHVLAADGIRVIRTPVRAPKANAYAERWVRTVRTECLDWLLIRNHRHLERVLAVYVEHCNSARPHRSLDLQTPLPAHRPPARTGRVEDIDRVDRLGGLIHEYRHAA